MSEFTNEDAIKHIDEHIKNMERLKDKFKPKPNQKIIDLSMVGSDIDCEFLGEGESIEAKGKLESIAKSSIDPYRDEFNDYWPKCRIRQDHWFYNPNGWSKCPVPEGLHLYIERSMSTEHFHNYMHMDWSHVKAFKVLGTTDNWIYKLQKEKEE